MAIQQDDISTKSPSQDHVEKSLQRLETSVTMPPELFEKLYLTPKVPYVKNHNQRLANPTALGFAGFVIATFTFSMVLMGWGGSSGYSPIISIFFFVAPVTLLFSMVFEWVMGNFFSMLVMGVFAVFWLSFGLLQLPSMPLALPYATAEDPTGMNSPAFNADVGLFLIVWGFAIFTFFIFALKISAAFALLFALFTAAVWCLAGSYFKMAAGDLEAVNRLHKAAGALLFVGAAIGWYITFTIMAAEMQIPINLPVRDLSHFWPRRDPKMSTEYTRRLETSDTDLGKSV
ncbi:GPR1/FUN34/yaaH family-domain-containing protein [Xylariaceae sp. FL1651]|nr:GPR1/FUN34/yaaH family-domain-containing protein [Xylariaceae sp. FL1651]